MAFNTSTAARWTILSSSAGTPRGRLLPSALSMYTLFSHFPSYPPPAPPAPPPGQLLRVARKVLSVGVPRHAVPPGCRIALEREVSRLQAFDRVHMVHQRGEPGLPVAFRCLSYAIERAVHVIGSARCPARVRCVGISLGSRP